MLIEIISFMTIGAFTGIAAGLLGIGGGLIIVPFTLMVFDYLTGHQNFNIPHELQAHVAIATSLATIIFTAVSAIYSQHRKKAIDWSVFWQLVPGILAGAFMGAWLATYIPRTWLLLVFAGFLMLVSIKMWFGWSPRHKAQLPSFPVTSLVALLIGMVSSLVGIGGGTMTVPFLNRSRIAIQHAVAISSALGLPIALFGTLGFYWRSLENNIGGVILQPGMLGYVYLPAFFAIISLSVLTAPVGVYLSHRLSKQALSRFFSILLIILALKIIYGLING